MTKSKKGGPQQRIRKNPQTGQVEIVAGRKAGKKRNRLPFGHPLRTHDLHGLVGKKKRNNVTRDNED